MYASGSIFLNVNVPNAATWFYLSLLLAIALFFKFSRFLSVRNLDVVTLFLLVPGWLLWLEPRPHWFAYLWLLCGSAYLLLRCLLDLTLVRRPALNPNLNLGGLAWLAGALFICLAAVAFRPSPERHDPLGRASVAQEKAQELITGALERTQVPLGNSSQALFWVVRILAVLCHLAIVAALIVIGCRHFQDPLAGMAAAALYLLLPYTAYHIAYQEQLEQWHHVFATALLLWAAALYRWPMVAGSLLGLAAGSAYFPLLLLPLWLSFYWRRGAGRFAAAFVLAVGVSLGVIGFILWLDGELAQHVRSVLNLSDWQPWKETRAECFWTGIPGAWAYRMPVFIACLAFIGTTAFWPAPKNLAHVLALSAAILLSIQFWYANHGGLYVLWYLPLLLLLVFRPNLSDRQPPPIMPETDWLARVGRAIARGCGRLVRMLEPRQVVRSE
jgi:hypothetical protein